MRRLTEKIIGAAIEVHTALGPGLLESTYEECMAREMQLGGLEFERQVPLPVAYKGMKLDCGYRLDFLVARAVVLELKSVDAVRPIHEAQLLTYLRLGGWTVGLLMYFNVPVLKHSIKRVVLNYQEPSAPSAPLR
jgi:GxxExxY protein